jgi:hypothetical protein
MKLQNEAWRRRKRRSREDVVRHKLSIARSRSAYDRATPLFTASYPETGGSPSQAGANLEVKDKLGNTPLISQASAADSEDVIEALLTRMRQGMAHGNRSTYGRGAP